MLPKVQNSRVQGTVSPVACAGLSQAQLRQLLNALMHTPTGVVQQVGHLLKKFCTTASQVRVPTSGGGCGDSARTWGEVVRGGPAHSPSAAMIADAPEQAEALFVTNPRKKEKQQGDSSGINRRMILTTNRGRRGAVAASKVRIAEEKVKTLRSWAAKNHINLPFLLQLLQPGGAGNMIGPGDARLLQAQATAISMENAEKVSGGGYL